MEVSLQGTLLLVVSGQPLLRPVKEGGMLLHDSRKAPEAEAQA